MESDQEQPGKERSQQPPWTISLLISASGVLVGAGITWGAYSQRLTTVEAAGQRADGRVDKVESLALSHDRQLAEQRTQFVEILRRLERIEQKLERQP